MVGEFENFQFKLKGILVVEISFELQDPSTEQQSNFPLQLTLHLYNFPVKRIATQIDMNPLLIKNIVNSTFNKEILENMHLYAVEPL